MENVINEFNDQEGKSANSVIACEELSNQILTTTCIFCEHDHAAVLQEIDLAISTPEIDSDLSECHLGVIHHKRIELDSIQKDLDELMSRLNTFIDEVDENVIDVNASPFEEGENEKQDGPSEKELRLDYLQTNNKSAENGYYTCDPLKPPEINWDSVGPILQKHVSDLQKIHELNKMTNAVVQRIRSVARVDENILKIRPNEENCE